MRSFLHPPRGSGFEEEEYVDPDIVEPVFFPETVHLVEDDDDEVEVYDENDDDYDDEDESPTLNVGVSASETTQIILNGVIDEIVPPHLSPIIEYEEDGATDSDSSSPVHSSLLVESPRASTSDSPAQVDTALQSSTTDPQHQHPATSNKRPGLSPDPTSVPQSKRYLRVPDEDSAEGQSENEAYSNPLASAEEGDGIDDEAFRGDRIGETTYSERHVLRILMKWIEELPKYSGPITVIASCENGTLNGDDDDEKKLERVFKKEMSLLWDMSAEHDVTIYLVGKGIFGIIHDTLVCSTCSRLTEISLGILANILSTPEMTKTLSEEDSVLKLIETVVSVGSRTTDVPILLQVFAVLRRITWFMHHVKPVGTWISDTIGSPLFLDMLTLILKRSTHEFDVVLKANLLKEAVMVVFFLLEALIRVSDDEKEEGSSGESILDDRVSSLGTEPVVTSLCEGLQELLKSRENDDDVSMSELIDEHKTIPDDIKQSLRSGLGALCFIQKIPTGLETLRKENTVVAKFVTSFFDNFVEVTSDLTKSQGVEYFLAGLNLLLSCHLEFAQLQPNFVLNPFTAAQKLFEDEIEIKNSIYPSLQEHLLELTKKFAKPELIWTTIKGDPKIMTFLQPIHENLKVTLEAKDLEVP